MSDWSADVCSSDLVAARDCRRAGQWIVSKGQDSFAPMGPCIVTADEIGDPHNLNILTHVNGVEKQNSNTRFMLFNINQLIADISSVMTLEPGDILAKIGRESCRDRECQYA